MRAPKRGQKRSSDAGWGSTVGLCVLLAGGVAEERGRLATELRARGYLVQGDPPDDPRAFANANITGREREVLELLARGHSYVDVARALAVRLTTVQAHVRNLYRKLGVSSKAEAAVLAVRAGVLG
jgi:DNA-binding NarL/FixJ family response regulator